MSLQEISGIIASQIGINPEEISPASRFKEDLKIDSLDIFEIIMELEDKYSMRIPTGDLEDMVTVADLLEYIKSRR